MLSIDHRRSAARISPHHDSTPPIDRRQLIGLRCEWRRLARQLADPAVELDSDTFAAVLACYHRLKAAGGVVDAMADALIRQGAYQLADASL